MLLIHLIIQYKYLIFVLVMKYNLYFYYKLLNINISKKNMKQIFPS